MKSGNISSTKRVKTKLSYHPEWVVTDQEKYVYQYNHQKLPPLEVNQISVNAIKMYEYDDGFVISAFLRSSLPKPITFETLDLVVVDKNNKPVARKSFEMDLFGELPSNTCRPWRFLFEKEDQLEDKMPKKGWNLVFELKSKKKEELTLDLEDSWKDMLTDEQKTTLQNLMQNMPPLREGEVNFMGLEASFNEESGLAVTLLIRNGSDRNITIENLPLTVEDANQTVTANASFELNLEIKAKTCKPWTFVYPNSTLKTNDFDLSRWKAYVPSDSAQNIQA